MEKTINEFGKEVWSGISCSDKVTKDMFHEIIRNDGGDVTQALHTNLGSITILDRMTGYGYREVETGYRDKEGKFWLASGNFDIMTYGFNNIGDMISAIKSNANTCVGQ